MKTGALPVADGVWRITTPMPFRPRIVHAYLVRNGERGWMLVDGGINTDEAWIVLDGAVQDVAGGWGELDLHLVTHMHMDHQGLSERVRRAGRAPLAMGALDAERAAHATADPAEEARYREALLASNGAPEAVVHSLQAGRAGADSLSSFVPADYPLPCGTAPVPHAEGWEAVWTPGHTAGHVSLFRPADRLLLAGDAVLPGITPTIGVNRHRPDPVGDYLFSLAQLEGLAPTLALSGHGGPITDPAERIRELRSATREETARVAGLLSPRPTSAWDVTRARYADRDLPASSLMLAFRETLAHLQHLVAAGQALREAEEGVERFQLA